MRTSKDLQEAYRSAAAQALPPIAARALAALTAEGDVDVAALHAAITEAFLAGVRVGEAEMLAQAAEQGAHLRVVRPGIVAG